MSPRRSDAIAIWVPPRLRRRSTGTPCAVRICAYISPSSNCSVKFFDPTVTRCPRPHDGRTGAEAPFAEPQQCLRRQREDGDAGGSLEQHPRVVAGQAVDDQFAEAAATDE